MKKKVSFLFVLMSLLCFTISASAETFKVAIMQLPTSKMYQQLFIALGEATDNKFETEVLPVARATNMIESKMVDIQVPRIKGKNEAYNKSLKYDFSEANTGNVIAFVLYTNKENPIDIAALKNGNSKNYKIETDGANLKQFGFTAIFSAKPEQSFKKLNAKRIDGYINSQTTCDPVLKSLKLTNIKRELWDGFDVGFAIQKGQAGGKLDRILSDGIKKLQTNGKLEQIVGASNRRSKYNNWQP